MHAVSDEYVGSQPRVCATFSHRHTAISPRSGGPGSPQEGAGASTGACPQTLSLSLPGSAAPGPQVSAAPRSPGEVKILLLPDSRGLAGDGQASEDRALLSLLDRNRHTSRSPTTGVHFRLNVTVLFPLLTWVPPCRDVAMKDGAAPAPPTPGTDSCQGFWAPPTPTNHCTFTGSEEQGTGLCWQERHADHSHQKEADSLPLCAWRHWAF